MGGRRTTRAIKNSVLRPIRTAQMSFGLRSLRRSPTKRCVRTRRYGPTPQTIRAHDRRQPGARAAPTIRGIRVAEGVAGLAALRHKARAEIAGKVGVAKGIEVGGAGGATAPRRAAPTTRTVTAKTMAATTRSN